MSDLSKACEDARRACAHADGVLKATEPQKLHLPVQAVEWTCHAATTIKDASGAVLAEVGGNGRLADEDSAIAAEIVQRLNPQTRDDHLIDAAQRKFAAGEVPTKDEANAYWAAALFNPAHQVYFRAGLIACREYMASFVEAQSPEIAASIRANWWPKLGPDFGPPRQMAWGELVEDGDDWTEGKPIKMREISPTLEALPIAMQFLQAPEPASPLGVSGKDYQTFCPSPTDGKNGP